MLGEKKIIHLTSDIGLLTSIRYQISVARLAGEAGLMCDILIVQTRNQCASQLGEKKIIHLTSDIGLLTSN